MRRAIADSDDEEEDLTSQVDNRIVDLETLMPAKENAHKESAKQDDEQTLSKSTGSLEKLRQDIRMAEQTFINSAPEPMDQQSLISAGSQAIKTKKRRATSVLGSQNSINAETTVKRTKTLKTYSASKLAQLAGDGGLGDQVMHKTSQSARFTEHSGVDSSAILPSGSLEEDFMGHEPNLLFPDSGSTVADPSSAQKRLLEQALAAKDDQTIPPGSAQVSDKQQNPSSPWSTSQPSGSIKTKNGPEPAQTGELTDLPLDASAVANQPDNLESANGHPDVQDHPKATTPKSSRLPLQPDRSSHVTGSPTVEIRRRKNDAAATAHDASASSQKPHRGRKRKAGEDQEPEPLVSDDRPIDLPAEQYKPRPSRRRATGIIEEPIDLSVKPEKVAKVKRNKTMPARGRSPEAETNLEGSATGRMATNADKKEVTKAKSVDIDPAVQPSSNEIRVVQKHPEDTLATKQGTDEAKQKSVLKEQPQDTASQQKPDETVFLKPAKLPVKKKLISKAKRAQTTIFEDHVDFRGSQSSPNLTQQQADRQSALQNVENDATKSRKKRQNVIADDEDDDEGEEAKQEDTAPPKKKARGRPPKSTTKPQADAEEKPLEQPNTKEDESDKISKATNARGRGRPPKTSAGDTSIAEADAPVYPPPGDLPSTDVETTHSLGHGATTKTGDVSGVSTTEAPSTKLQTPSQEKQEPRKAQKGSPTSHSPIKPNLRMPLRVGLSNRQRIPSLLRTMNPKR